MEKSTKSISTINPAIMENMECLIIKARASFIDLKGVYHLIMVYHYALFRF